jgi:S-adenosylmethionine/arginine decarboxylase-like enzyme
MLVSSLNCPLRISDSIGSDISDAIYSCDQTKSVEANLLDDGIDDTLASVGATIALHEIS